MNKQFETHLNFFEKHSFDSISYNEDLSARYLELLRNRHTRSEVAILKE